MYFLAAEEQRYLMKSGFLKARELGIAEELRGWNWHRPPLESAYDVKLALYEIASQYCPTGRDVFLRRVERKEGKPGRAMVEGAALHSVVTGVILQAKQLVYSLGVGQYEEIIRRLREACNPEAPLGPRWQEEAERLPEERRAEFLRKLRTARQFETDRVVGRLQDYLVRQPFIGPDSLVALALPVTVEHRLDGSYLGLSSQLNSDAYNFAEPMILDLKFGEPRPFHRLTTTGYALAMEAVYEFPVNFGCLVYVHFVGDRLRVTKDIHIISNELRQWFIEARDERQRMVAEELDPGKPDECPGWCQFYTVCQSA